MTANFDQYPASLDDRISQLSLARSIFKSELEAATSVQVPDGKWSPSELAYHLHMVERSVTRMLQKLLLPEAADRRHTMKSEEDLIAEWKRTSTIADPNDRPVEAPPRLNPQNAQTPDLSECISLLDQSRQTLLDFLSATSLADLISISQLHPNERIGVLSGAGWLSMLAFHELRHAEQLRKLKNR